MVDGQKAHQDLTVKGESIERIFGNYQGERYLVNRRYQRKLVWALDEKRRFIDSILNGYPVPIVLLAERKTKTVATPSQFEIIDGMQRLNAVFGFIENEYDVGGHFFDLNTMAATKALLDAGKLVQRQPMLGRDACVQIAGYTIPLSIYEFAGDGDVDEVFRRINSGGRKLSRQELRIAGSTGHFAQAVRSIAAKVRGDVSASDELPLNEMKKISITNRDLPYGIDVDGIFWIKQGVLTKEQVRESRDEELIADKALGRSLDDLFTDLTTRIKNSALSEPLRDSVARNVKSVRYYDKTVFVFEAQAQEEPSNFDGAFFVRHGNKLSEIPPSQYGELFKRFLAGL